MSLSVELKRLYIRKYHKIKGRKIKRKFLVIESDDWGTIRMPNIEVYNSLIKSGRIDDKLAYSKFDALESNDDLMALFDILHKFKDSNGQHPVITANTIMSNPDFDKIRSSEFKNYAHELFFETYSSYTNHHKVLELIKSGINSKVFFPQLHGMEHLNVLKWMSALQNKKDDVMFAFDHKLFDLSNEHTSIGANSFIDVLHPNNEDYFHFNKERLQLGQQIFEETFGYKSESFIAPCYIWNSRHEEMLKQIGIKYIQSGTFQLIPKLGQFGKFKKQLHYFGQHNKYGQLYNVRNCFFEPSSSNDKRTELEKCLEQINRAFDNNLPAVICSHRVNFMGGISEKNRVENLKYFEDLLKLVLKRHPDVEFVNTIELMQSIKD
jgi:hypothetical protein